MTTTTDPYIEKAMGLAHAMARALGVGHPSDFRRNTEALRTHLESRPAPASPPPTPDLAELRHCVRTAWLTGTDDFRRHYDKALFALLGIGNFQDLWSDQ